MNEKDQFHTVRGYQLLEKNKKNLTSAMEDYLEMIYRNSLEEGYMRINTLSELLNVRAPSATRMVQKLSGMGLLAYKKYGIIFLTENGKEIGAFLLERHQVIEAFLKNLGVQDSLLIETEIMEHSVSAKTLNKIDMLNKYLSSYPEVLASFAYFLDKRKEDELKS